MIHSVEMHLISIKVLIEMYFILIEILKNAVFLQPLYFESKFEKSWFERTYRKVTPVPPPRLRKIRKRKVVPPSSRVLRSHARLAKSAAGLAAALLLTAFDSLA